MGRRSTYTTKSGKFMNPTDQARKEARKRELKKNKKQRKMVREMVLKTKDPKRILDEIEKIESVEFDAGVEPLPNDKALKDKKKKLRETLERLQTLVEKSDPKKAGEIQKLLSDSEKRREHLQIEAYESMHAKLQAEQFANIPLPTNIPLPHSGMLMPSDIPLPGPLPGQQTLPPGLVPPGPPPGEPPIPSSAAVASTTVPEKSKPLHPPGVSDADYDNEGLEEGGSDVDYDDDGSSTSESGLDEDEYQQEMRIGDYAKMDTQDFSNKDDNTQDQHNRSVRFADEAVDPNKPVSKPDDPTSAVQRALLKIAGLPKGNKEKNSQTTDQRPTPPGPPPGLPGIPPRGIAGVQPNSQIPPPPTHLFPPGPPPRGPPGPPPRGPPGPPPRGPPGPPPRMPGGMPPRPPLGMPPGPPPGMPPGPPPGMPPNMAAQVMGRGPRPLMQQPMMPPGPPPRMPRPPGPPPPHMMMAQGSVLSAPPSVISKPPTAHPSGDGPPGGILKKTPGAVISAKPQIRNTQAELTKLVPTSLRVKRDAPKLKAKGKETLENIPSHEPRRLEQNISGQATKDDAYALFMKEMAGLL